MVKFQGVKEPHTFLFLSFSRVLNVIYSFLGNSPASEFICRRFGTHYRFHLHRQVNELHSSS